MTKESKLKADLFLLEKLYPEPKAIFTTGLRPLGEIKDDCLIVLDTNALLSPYDVGKESLEKISGVYRTLAIQKRLIVPAHVAREFAEHRPSKLAEIHEKLLDRKSSFIQSTKNVEAYHLLESLPEYGELLEKEKQISEQVKALKRDYFVTIERLIKEVRDWLWNDPVTNVYASIFTDDVLFSPNLDEEALNNEADKRKRYKIPPGYKDYREGELESRNPAGDLIIWFSILGLASRGKDIIFVSGEQKADWWHRSSTEANNNLYPRYELVEEYRNISEGKSFHMLSLSSFLELFGADEAVVGEVKDEESKTDFVHGSFTDADLFPLIFNWLENHYPFCEVSTASDFHDFTVDCKESRRIIVEYFASANTENFPRSVRTRAHSLQMYVRHFNLQGGVLLIILRNSNEASFIERTYGPTFKDDSPNVDLIVGYVENINGKNVFIAVQPMSF